MPTSFVQPILQVFDDYGVMLAGGTIQTFEAGTNTPLATYQDLEGQIANTNPVVLDSAGRAVIRVTNGVAYKFVISDGAGNLLLTLDYIIIGASASTSGVSYLVHLSGEGTPGAQGFMGGHIFDDAVTFPIDFEGAQGVVRTVPSSDFTISIQKNSVEIGTATISAAGAYTFATTGGSTMRLYLDGVMIAKEATAGAGSGSNVNIKPTSTAQVWLGGINNNSGEWPLNGYLDEVRVVTGQALCASDSGFTVPTSAYPRS